MQHYAKNCQSSMAPSPGVFARFPDKFPSSDSARFRSISVGDLATPAPGACRNSFKQHFLARSAPFAVAEGQRLLNSARPSSPESVEIVFLRGKAATRGASDPDLFQAYSKSFRRRRRPRLEALSSQTKKETSETSEENKTKAKRKEHRVGGKNPKERLTGRAACIAHARPRSVSARGRRRLRRRVRRRCAERFNLLPIVKINGDSGFSPGSFDLRRGPKDSFYFRPPVETRFPEREDVAPTIYRIIPLPTSTPANELDRCIDPRTMMLLRGSLLDREPLLALSWSQ